MDKYILLLLGIILFALTFLFYAKEEFTVTYIDSISNEVIYTYITEEGREIGPNSVDSTYEGYYYNGTFTTEGKEVTYIDPVLLESDLLLIITFEPYEYFTTIYELDEAEYILNIYVSRFSHYVLTSNHRVLAYGGNKDGLLGMTHVEMTDQPEDLTSQFPMAEGEYIVDITVGFVGVVFSSNLNHYYLLGDTIRDSTVHYYNKIIDITEYLDLEQGETITQIGDFYEFQLLTSNHRILTLKFQHEYFNVQDITYQFQLSEDDYITDLYQSSTGFAVSFQGKIFGWGYNMYGQIGNNEIDNEGEPVNITEQFNLNSLETVTDISNEGEYVLFLTSEHRLFATGAIEFLNLEDISLEYTTIPIDITNYIPLQPEETINQIFSFSQVVILVTNTNRKIAIENPQLLQGEEVTAKHPMDLTDAVPANIVSTGYSYGMYYFFDNNNQVYIMGISETDNIPYRDKMNLTENTCTLTSVNYTIETCYTILEIMNITEYFQVGYSIQSSFVFNYNQDYDIIGDYNDLHTGLAAEDYITYPNYNLYLVAKEN